MVRCTRSLFEKLAHTGSSRPGRGQKALDYSTGMSGAGPTARGAAWTQYSALLPRGCNSASSRPVTDTSSLRLAVVLKVREIKAAAVAVDGYGDASSREGF